MQSERESVFEKWFRGTVVIVLLVTGSLKLITTLGDAENSLIRDPIFLFIRQQHMLIGVGILEIAVALFVTFQRNTLLKLWAILWLCGAFIAYRVGLFLIGFKGNCGCLGKPQSWLYERESKNIDRTLAWILCYMTFFSAFFLLLRYVRPAPQKDPGVAETV
jgi:hypothetical protein